MQPSIFHAGIKFREMIRQFPVYTTAFRIQKLCVLFVFDWSLVFVDVAFATFEIESLTVII